ncbi:MAG: hypothetical protein DI537_62805, partial [Stutzerimonas stutzeri]
FSGVEIRPVRVVDDGAFLGKPAPNELLSLEWLRFLIEKIAYGRNCEHSHWLSILNSASAR